MSARKKTVDTIHFGLTDFKTSKFAIAKKCYFEWKTGKILISELISAAFAYLRFNVLSESFISGIHLFKTLHVKFYLNFSIAELWLGEKFLLFIP